MTNYFNTSLMTLMKRLRIVVFYVAGFYQLIEISSLYKIVKLDRNHPVFFISNFSSLHLCALCILLNENCKKTVLHLNLFIIINAIWLMVILWNVIYIFYLAHSEVKELFIQDPLEHVLLFFYVITSVVLEIFVIFIRRHSLKEFRKIMNSTKKKFFDFMSINELGKEWLTNKFLELCVISLFLVLYRLAFYVYCMYLANSKKNSSLYSFDRGKQFMCDLADCTIFILLNIIGITAILNTNYSFICMLLYVPISLNVSIYELGYLFKLISLTQNRHSVINALFTFYYATNLFTSSIVGGLLLKDLLIEYQDLIS